MLPISLFIMIAAPLMARGSPVPNNKNTGDDKVQVFKRDQPLDARDLELASLHGVNTTEMFKHSVVRRDDGDHVTIWVARSFTSLDESPEHLEERGVRTGSQWLGRGSPDLCGHSSFRQTTNPNSPFTGGILEMSTWGNNNRGEFMLPESGWSDLIITGSNSGANARFSTSGSSSGNSITYVGSYDIRDLSRDTEARYRREYNGRSRAGADGSMGCRTVTCIGNCGIPVNGNRNVNWAIDRSNTNV
ncbi:hypothetical protein HJFPF1_10482 [Paramyrothecium foliicola]|nr:hypothetical protein HJFPF1_10482 [Paramyrothecium foliicola]